MKHIFNTTLSKRTERLLIFLLPLSIYVVISLFTNSYDNFETQVFLGDQQTYFNAAQSFYGDVDADAYRCIGYPLFLGIPQLFGIDPPYGWWPVALNLIFLLFILNLFLRIEELMKLRFAIGAAILLSVSFSFLKAVNLALTELGYSFFILLSVYYFIKIRKRNEDIKNLFWFIFSLGLATLFRPGLLIFTMLFSFIYVLNEIIFFKGENKVRNIVIKTTTIALSLALTIGIQSLLMKKTFDTFRLSYIGDLAWYYYIGALANAAHESNCFTRECFKKEQSKRDLLVGNKTPKEMAEISKVDRKRLFKEDKRSILRAYITNVFSNLVSCSIDSSKNPMLYKISVWFNMLFSIFPFILYGGVLIFRVGRKSLSGSNIAILYGLSIIAFTILTSGVSSNQGDRLHLVFYPISIVIILMILSKIRVSLKEKLVTS